MLITIKADETAYITDNAYGGVSERAHGRTLARGERVIINDVVYKVIRKQANGDALCQEVGQAPAYGHDKPMAPVAPAF
jgi:hypothetical protein